MWRRGSSCWYQAKYPTPPRPAHQKVNRSASWMRRESRAAVTCPNAALVCFPLVSNWAVVLTVDTCIDVSEFVGHKIRATAAHRSQYPIDPALFPRDVLQQMFGVEYFTQVVPERELRSSLFDDAQSSAAMSSNSIVEK